MGSALSMRFCQRYFGLWAWNAETYDDRSRGCVRPRGAPPSDIGNELDGVFAGDYAGSLVHGQVRAFAKQQMHAGDPILET